MAVISIEQIEAKKDEYEKLLVAFLRQQGWVQTGIPPGLRFWKKTHNGIEHLCKAESAMNLETVWALLK